MSTRHVFHTRHDFTPEFAWAAFQLLAGIGPAGIAPSDLYNIAKATASPLTKRSDLSKLLAAMDEVGLTERGREHVSLTVAGECLAKSLGRYREGFYVAVHCLYSWMWLWEGEAVATPSWSYREVCSQLLDAGTAGVGADELVLRVVSSAARAFQAEKISFSRSSVTGVTMWLEAQSPQLIQRRGSRIFTHNISGPMADALRIHAAALCAYAGREALLDSRGVRLLAECFLMPADELIDYVVEFAQASKEFLLIPGTPNRLIFSESEDPFINWMVTSVKRKSTAA
ncbi:MAG: hypothetical protein LC803_18420 [Acidobacteria bacterium]|nr:hypothetical protein [Acidobacteriota bacterium]